MTNQERKFDLSNKFLEMGRALLIEGNELGEYTITQSGTILTLVSTLILIEEDMVQFNELCAMFSAKKLMDSLSGEIGPLSNDILKQMSKAASSFDVELGEEKTKKRRGGRKKKNESRKTNISPHN